VWAQETGVDVRAGIHTPASKSPTVALAADAWIDHAASEGREHSTLAQYRQHAKHITDRIGHYKLANLTKPMIVDFRTKLLLGSDPLPPLSHAMARKAMVSLRSLLKHAHESGKVAQSPRPRCHG
jgi:hypothetical protein